jgi:hypothetical protein
MFRANFGFFRFNSFIYHNLIYFENEGSFPFIGFCKEAIILDALQIQTIQSKLVLIFIE